MSHFEIEVTDVAKVSPESLLSHDLWSASSKGIYEALKLNSEAFSSSEMTNRMVKKGFLPQFEISNDDLNLNQSTGAQAEVLPKQSSELKDKATKVDDPFDKLEKELGLTDSKNVQGANGVEHEIAAVPKESDQRTFDIFTALEEGLGLPKAVEENGPSGQIEQSTPAIDAFKHLEEGLGLSN